MKKRASRGLARRPRVYAVFILPLASPEVATRFQQPNIDTRPTTPEEFARFVQEQMKLLGGVVKEANIKLG